MNGCEAVQAKFSEYLDGRLNGREMQQISAHVNECQECTGEWDSLRQVQLVAGGAGAGARAKGFAAARSRGSQPGTRAQQTEHLQRLEPGLEKHGWTVPVAGFCRLCQRRAAAGHGHRPGNDVYAA